MNDDHLRLRRCVVRDQLDRVEPGKVADLSIVEGDPLKDIWATQNVKLVVLNGKVVEHEFTGYVNPIPEFNSWQQLSTTIEVSPAAFGKLK